MWIVAVVFLAIIIPIIFFFAKQATQSHKNYSNGIVNHNASFSEFVYEIHKPACDIWRILNSYNASLPLKNRFNEAGRTIVFYPELPDGSIEITYRISLMEHNGHNILKLTQENHLLEKNGFWSYQNEFWYKAIGATPYPYILLPM